MTSTIPSGMVICADSSVCGVEWHYPNTTCVRASLGTGAGNTSAVASGLPDDDPEDAIAYLAEATSSAAADAALAWSANPEGLWNGRAEIDIPPEVRQYTAMATSLGQMIDQNISDRMQKAGIEQMWQDAEQERATARRETLARFSDGLDELTRQQQQYYHTMNTLMDKHRELPDDEREELLNHIKTTNIDSIEKERSNWKRKRNKALREVGNVQSTPSGRRAAEMTMQIIADELGAVRDMGGGSLRTDPQARTTKAARAALDSRNRVYPTEWLNDAGPVIVQQRTADSAHFYMDGDGKAIIAVDPNQPYGTAVHEIAHYMEATKPEIAGASFAFLAQRAGNPEQIQGIRGSMYGKQDKVRQPRGLNSQSGMSSYYSAVLYRRRKKRTEVGTVDSRSTEVFSTGMENLLVPQPYNAEKDMMYRASGGQDPEHRHLVLGLLATAANNGASIVGGV